MNKEALRKELEDCWNAGYENGNIAKPRKQTREAYITTRLAALDDGDVKERQAAKDILYNGKHFFKDQLDSLNAQFGGNFSAAVIGAMVEYAVQFTSKPLDDGQEGKGLQSGKPSPQMWFDAVNKLSDALESFQNHH